MRKSLSNVEKNVCKLVVIKSDWSGLKISIKETKRLVSNSEFK